MSLIIGAIVFFVIAIFGIVVLQSQKVALMSRMTQVCDVLVQNLAETVKGDLLLEQNDKVMEAVLRLQKTTIEGLKQIAIINRKGKVVAFADREQAPLKLEAPAEFLKLEKTTSVEKSDRYEFIYPITTLLQERGTDKHIKLGVAYISFSKDAILAPIKRAQDIAVGVAFLILLVSILAINVIARKMAFQIQMLSNGAREVGKGNLNVQIAVRTKDELGQLANEFNNMIQHLREKLQMQKFVSKYTVDMIKDTVRSNKFDSVAILRNVAVLFSDVRNFSTISEELEPEEIVKLINVYFDLQTRVIEKHGGIVDKFMGDQIMAVFEGARMADNALRAAVEMQQQMRLLNQERRAKKLVTLEMGIGINNGPAVSGHMGSKNRMDYTVIGDVVNVAARLCSQARCGQIIAALELARKANGSYPTTRLKSISVKGRSKSVKICEVDYNREILT
ncbi:MAG: adenylate/guanylate cyclase domain-containing protein [bacterium]